MNEFENTDLVVIGSDRDGAPIWLIQGGAPDDDDTDEDGGDGEEGDDEGEEGEDEEDGEESDDESDSDEDDKPPAKKAPAKKVAAKKAPAKIPPRKFNPSDPKYKNALQRERARAVTAEKQLKELRRSNETQAETRLREADEAAEAKYKPVAVAAAARAALVEAGIKGDPTRGVRLMDMAEIDFADGEAIGLDDQIAAIMSEYPEMFDTEEDKSKKPAKKAAAKVNPGNRKPVAENGGKKMSSAEKIAKMVEDGDYDGMN